MEQVNSVYEAWKAGILDKHLAGEDGSDHSSPAILNVPMPVDHFMGVLKTDDRDIEAGCYC